MDLLLDTHVFLWWNASPGVLRADARAAIGDRENQIFVSAASVWEIAIKRRSGKLAFTNPVVPAVAVNGFSLLPIVGEDAELAGALDWAHPDPFDRLLVAQCANHKLVLVTADEKIRGRVDILQMPAR